MIELELLSVLIKKEKEIKDFEDFEECFLANKWTMKTDTTKLEER